MEDQELDGSYCKFFGAFAKVYTLSDESGNIFYVGCTTSNIQLRTAQHLSEARTNARYGNKKKNDLIKSLNFKIVVKIVDMLWVTARKSSDTIRQTTELENSWIVKFHSLGYDLCNRRRIKGLFPQRVEPRREFVGQTFVTTTNRKKEIEILESEVKVPAK